MLIDSHAHIYDEMFGDNGANEIISRMNADGLDYIVCVGCDIDTSVKCVELAKTYDGVYATIGVHPYDAAIVTPQNIDVLRKLSACDKVVAVGEIGLDFHRPDSQRELQINAMAAQYDLARELELPMVFHIRDGFGEFYEFAKSREFPQGGVLHCFSGSAEIAEYYVKKNFYISFSGTVTYKNAVNIVRAAAAVPLDRLLVETDSPYLTPEPIRMQQINYPKNVAIVAAKLAEIKGIGTEEIIKATADNAKRVFGIE